ncbi:MAG: haloacid dehalogenase-like hydrolase [Nanoarchaeota archaeon]|nr:haloacid dehalogenase-like hydrolase [Nanoarchaeota archaeon]
MSLIIPNQERLKEIKETIKKSGKENLHIIADFDRTLTYSLTSEGKKLSSVIAILRDGNYLSKGYSEKAHALFDKYHPIEIDASIPIEEKKKAMVNWWTSHFNLLIESGLSKKDLESVVASGISRLREGTKELFDYLHKENIPIVIISANGIGNVIPMILEKEKILYNNIYVITNLFEFYEDGKAFYKPKSLIHSMNKDETAVQDHPEIYEKIKDRKNVILIGDSLGDLEMTAGFEYESLLKIGFLNPGEEDNLEEYERNFDIIIKDDGDFSEINKLIKDIK